jgi:MurNAc alpha-1-phosphate uridylyltransferase
MLAKSIIADRREEWVFSTNVFWDRAIAAGRCYGLVHDGAWVRRRIPEAIGLTEAALTEADAPRDG